MKSTERGEIAFISNTFSELIGTIIQEPPHTQVIFDRSSNHLLILDQLNGKINKTSKK